MRRKQSISQKHARLRRLLSVKAPTKRQRSRIAQLEAEIARAGGKT